MAIETFASVEDLEQRYRSLESSEKTKAEALLQDATALITSELRCANVAIREDDELQRSALRAVTCSVVRRALAGGCGDSITQSSTTTGPFSRQVTFANPTADLYLTKQDKRALGINQGGGFFFIRPKIGGDDD